ncbi:MAG: hypothetical protein HY818_05295 [Acetobacterium woodii]|nr:hypothetical protein [Acetobacterium woodii]
MKKKIGTIVICVGLTGMVFMMGGCSADQNRVKEEAYQETQMTQATAEIGMPEITEFYEKKMAKEILEMRDDSSLICYAYSKSDMTGKYVYLGKCMGFGLPYSTQYTNPEQKVDMVELTLPQADPNGLYSPDGVSATWLMMIDETTGERSISYNENDVIVQQTKIPARLVESFSLTADY